MMNALKSLALVCGLALLAGCIEDRKPDPPDKEGGIKVRAPGVDVDIQRTQDDTDKEKRRKKVDVDVDVDR